MNIEKITMWASVIIAIAIPVADFLGVIDNTSWIHARLTTWTLLAIGMLMAYLMAHLSRREADEQKNKAELLSAINIEGTLKDFRDTLEKSWSARKADIERIFTEAVAHGHNKDSLAAFLAKTFLGLSSGQFFGSTIPLPWDFTLLAIDYDGNILFHPSIPRGERIEVDSYLQGVLKERNGDLVWINNSSSEQLFHLFPNRPPTNRRFTRAYFRDISDARALVIFESHINIVDRLPALQHQSRS